MSFECLGEVKCREGGGGGLLSGPSTSSPNQGQGYTQASNGLCTFPPFPCSPLHIQSEIPLDVVPLLAAVADLGGDPGVQWNPPFGRVLRNYEGFVVVLRVIGALAIVYVTLSLSALAFTKPITRAHSNSLHKSARHKPIRSTRVHGRD